MRGLLGESDMRGLVASVLAVVEREADAEITKPRAPRRIGAKPFQLVAI